MADCSLALPLIEGIEAECLLADKAYDTNEIIATGLGNEPGDTAQKQPERKAGNEPGDTAQTWPATGGEKRDYDQALYKLRHLVENGFLDFKQWRGVATRLCQESGVMWYLAICQLRAVMIWSKLF